jgi:hypothetical protein
MHAQISPRPTMPAYLDRCWKRESIFRIFVGLGAVDYASNRTFFWCRKNRLLLFIFYATGGRPKRWTYMRSDLCREAPLRNASIREGWSCTG